jgi:hypothetical protein
MMQALRDQNPQVAQQAAHDLRNAEASLSNIPRTQINAPMHGATDILQGVGDGGRAQRARDIEMSAAAAGDPRPDRPSSQAMNEYLRLTERAYRQADLASHSDEARRPALHAFMTFMGGHHPEPSAREVGESALTRANERLEGPLFAVSIAENLLSAEQTYVDSATPQGRFRAALHNVALAESGGEEARAQQLMRRLSQTGQQLDANWQWLQRHQDHPGSPQQQDQIGPL